MSISANIAEGNGRPYRADYLRFLTIALGSANEVESHLRVIEALECEDPGHLNAALALSTEVGRMLGGLIRALRDAPPRHRR